MGVLLGFGLLFRYKNTFHLTTLKEVLKRSELLRFLHINRDIFIRTLILTFAFALFYAQAAKHNADTLAVIILLLLQFVIWFAYVLDGFANAAESLVDKYYGAKDWTTFIQLIQYIFLWGLGFTVAYMLFYLLFREAIIGLYTSQSALIAKTLPFISYVVALPLLSFTAYIWYWYIHRDNRHQSHNKLCVYGYYTLPRNFLCTERVGFYFGTLGKFYAFLFISRSITNLVIF